MSPGGYYVVWLSEGEPDRTGAQYPGPEPVIQLSDFTATSFVLSQGVDPRFAVERPLSPNTEVDGPSLRDVDLTTVPTFAVSRPYTQVP